LQCVSWTEIDIRYTGVTGLLIAHGLKQVRRPKKGYKVLD
jgi:hypothetical protein